MLTTILSGKYRSVWKASKKNSAACATTVSYTHLDVYKRQIYGLMNEYTPEDTVNFGVAASAVKHTIHGDGNITDDVSMIRHVMEMNFDIKR